MKDNEETQVEKKGGFAGQSFATLIGVLFVFIALSGNGAVTPALNVMKTGLWTELPASTISLINTLPSLFAIAGCIISGAIAGKHLTWKTTVVIAFVIYTVFGIAPAVLQMTDFYLTLAMRAGYGLGMGMLWPMGNALILRLYEGHKQGTVLGWGQGLQSLGGVIMTTLGGFFAAIAPQYAYYAYLIALVGLVICWAGLPNLPKEKVEKKEKAKIPAKCYVYLFLLFLGIMCITTPLIASSTIMAERGFGGSAFSGIVASCYTIGGVVAGLAFGFSWKSMKEWAVPVYYAGCAVAMIIIIFSSSALMLGFGLFFAAFCFIQVRPSIFEIIGSSVTPAQIATMIGVSTAVFNFGNFCTTYFIKAVNALFFGGVEGVCNGIWGSFVVYVILAVVMSIVFVVKKSKAKAEA